MAKSLTEITQELSNEQKATNESVKDLNKLFTDYFKKMEYSSGDRLEAEREKSSAKVATRSAALASGAEGGGKGLFPFGFGIVGSLGTITAGLAALGAALAGLRGWELNALKSIKNIKVNVPLNISNAVIRMRNSVYRIFGLTPEGLLDPKGPFGTRAPSVAKQLQMRINAIRLRVLNLFGLGADGKPITLKGDDNLFKRNIIGRVTFQINRLLKPLINVSEGVARFATGVGKRIFDFIRGIGGTAGSWLKVFGNILKPLGLFISAYDGYKDWLAGDGKGLIDRLGDGVSGFLASFVGAPFDLIKGAALWILKKIFPGLTNEDGSYDTTTIAGRVAQLVEEFSFTDLIKKLVDAPFNFIQGAWDWIKGAFADPKATLTKMFEGSSIINTVSDWLSSFWEWFTGWLPDLTDISRRVTEKVTNMLPDWLKDSIGLGTMDEAAARLQEQNALKLLPSIDPNQDGKITPDEINRIIGSGDNYRVNLLGNAINKYNEARTARGEEVLPATAGAIAAAGVTINYNTIDQSQKSTTAVQNENKTIATTPAGYDRLDQVLTSRMDKFYSGFRIGGRQF